MGSPTGGQKHVGQISMPGVRWPSIRSQRSGILACRRILVCPLIMHWRFGAESRLSSAAAVSVVYVVVVAIVANPGVWTMESFPGFGVFVSMASHRNAFSCPITASTSQSWCNPPVCLSVSERPESLAVWNGVPCCAPVHPCILPTLLTDSYFRFPVIFQNLTDWMVRWTTDNTKQMSVALYSFSLLPQRKEE